MLGWGWCVTGIQKAATIVFVRRLAGLWSLTMAAQSEWELKLFLMT